MVTDIGALGFWIFIAAIVVAGIWQSVRQKAEKHETLRRIVEKTGTIDEAKLHELFKEDASDESKPGYAYRGLRIFGTIVMFLGAGIAAATLLAAGFGKLFGATQMFVNVTGWIAGISISAGIAMLGVGLFFSSRFATPPADSQNNPPAR